MKFFMVARDGGLDVGVDLVLILLDENAFLLGLDYTHQFLNLTQSAFLYFILIGLRHGFQLHLDLDLLSINQNIDLGFQVNGIRPHSVPGTFSADQEERIEVVNMKLRKEDLVVHPSYIILHEFKWISQEVIPQRAVVIKHCQIYIMIQSKYLAANIAIRISGVYVMEYHQCILLAAHNSIISFNMETKMANKGIAVLSQNLKLKEKSEVFSDVTHASQRSYKFQKTSALKHLNLEIFKVNPCNITKSHNHKHCINYHSAKDRKRYGNYYENTLCPYVKGEEKCPEGDNCHLAHSRVEELYSYQNYKKHFCSHFPNSVEECPYADFCSFGHSEEEILSNLIHNYLEDDDFYMFYYKTQFCPFNLTQHDKSKCVYAHNWQDYRRSPVSYTYEPIACFNWNTKDYIYDYSSGCEVAAACNMCHGWKEQQFHPSYYRTTKCEEEGCKKGCCPYYHSLKEKRVIQNEIINKAFRLVPKNRIVEGVFKSNANKEGYKSKQQYKSKTVINNRKNNVEENDFKTRTIINKKKPHNKRSSGDEIEEKWIVGKEIIDSEEESDEDNEVISWQVGRLNLDE